MFDQILVGLFILLICIYFKKSNNSNYNLPKGPDVFGYKTVILYYMKLKSAKDALKLAQIYLPLVDGLAYAKAQILRGPLMIVAKASHIRVAISNRKNIDKSIWGYPYVTVFRNGLICLSGEKWYEHRKLVQSVFNSRNLYKFQDVFSKVSSEIVKDLKLIADGQDYYPDKIFNIKLFNAAVENFCDITDPPYTQNELNEYLNAIEDELDYTTWMYIHYYLTYITDLFPYFFKRRRFYRISSLIMNKLKMAKTTPVPENPEDRTYMDRLRELNDEDFEGELRTVLIAGYATTSVTLNFTLTMLALHKHEQNLVYEEQKQIFGNSSRSIDTEDLSKMKRLEACIYETLRLYPTVPLIGRKLSHHVKFGGYEVPSDTSMGILIPVLHKDPQVWIKPNEFYPDHFCDLEIAKMRPPYSFLAFSSGPRQCIGLRYAMMSLKTNLSVILRNFEIHTNMQMKDLRVTRVVTNDARYIKLQFTARN